MRQSQIPAGSRVPNRISEISYMQSSRAILSFFAIAFLWSWAAYFAAVQAKPYSQALNIALTIVAGFGPSLAGFVVVALFGKGAGLRDWLARCLNWRLPWGWWALVCLAPPILMACALVLNSALGGSLPVLPAVDKIPLVILNFGLVALIGGPLGEEFGWRGYAMPVLRVKFGWRGASLIIGILWGLWHIPLFFIAGTAQSQMPIAVFMLNIVASSVVFGWVFDRTQQSVLPALVLHTSLNAWAGILLLPLAPSNHTYAVVSGLIAVIALVLLIIGPSQTDGELR